ncbi:uncharacterized protein [Lepeophtheirus salmonis]|uniref:uncharacterized protein n=1 Tax=Lepeophtheirus salmonis TaxID=72036 RepID=UPI001AE4C011|nr:ankyrin repeat, SAM and basic leucine zipper domain-containing protein 1-like [Lepeophtheirus salmonis]
MARPAGFSDSEDEFDDFVNPDDDVKHKDDNEYGFISPKKDLFQNIQVPSFKDLNSDVDGFRHALTEGDVPVVKKYLETHKVELRAPIVSASDNWSDMSPLEIAATNGHITLLEYLLKESQNESKGDGPCLLTSISCSPGDKKPLVECAKLLLPGEDVNRVEITSGMTPLMYASKFGFIDLVKLFVSHGADVDYRDYNKWTALCHAANTGHGDVVRYLLVDAEASSNVTTTEGFQPSDISERKGHKYVTEVFDTYSDYRSVFRGMMRNEDDANQHMLMILNGFALTKDEIDAFFREGVRDLATLITLTENDLSHKIGIKRVGVVNSISEFIKDMHRKEWKRSCLPKFQVYDPSQGLKFSCPESIAVVGNIRKQLVYLRSSVIYLQRGIVENPKVLQIGKDVGNVSDLYKFCKISASETEGLAMDLIKLKKTLYPYLNSKYMPVDEIKFDGMLSRRTQWILTSLASLSIGVLIMRKCVS